MDCSSPQSRIVRKCEQMTEIRKPSLFHLRHVFCHDLSTLQHSSNFSSLDRLSAQSSTTTVCESPVELCLSFTACSMSFLMLSSSLISPSRALSAHFFVLTTFRLPLSKFFLYSLILDSSLEICVGLSASTEA